MASDRPPLKKLEKSFVILRFSFGKDQYKARQRTENTSRYVISRVGINYAGGLGDNIDLLKERIEDDLHNELSRQASLYRKYILGTGGTKTSPTGTLSTAAAGGPTQSLSGTVEWRQRTLAYLKRKRKYQGSIEWFNTYYWDKSKGGKRSTSGPVGGGRVLPAFSSAQEWTAAFGSISVDFNKRNDIESQADAYVKTSSAKKMHLAVGEMRIRALGNITPDMLPGLAKAGVTGWSGGVNRGLIGLVNEQSPEAAKRLGGVHGIYRPTLEPFLTFFLTQSLQHAVNTRLSSQGLKQIGSTYAQDR